VVQVLPPRPPQVVLENPFREHAIEAFEEPLLDAPPRRALDWRALVLVLEMVGVVRERLELLPPRRRCSLRPHGRRSRRQRRRPPIGSL
jgi:hypothetical protein